MSWIEYIGVHSFNTCEIARAISISRGRGAARTMCTSPYCFTTQKFVLKNMITEILNFVVNGEKSVLTTYKLVIHKRGRLFNITDNLAVFISHGSLIACFE